MKSFFVYAIQNRRGEWMRSKGYSGGGNKWVDDLSKAKIYTKIGSAKGQVTWWADHIPDAGRLKLIKLLITVVGEYEDEKELARTRKIRYAALKRQIREREEIFNEMCKNKTERRKNMLKLLFVSAVILTAIVIVSLVFLRLSKSKKAECHLDETLSDTKKPDKKKGK
jgi:predicted nucleic acid-binding Zn ribbon protein